jgi:hypothetical protein
LIEDWIDNGIELALNDDINDADIADAHDKIPWR